MRVSRLQSKPEITIDAQSRRSDQPLESTHQLPGPPEPDLETVPFTKPPAHQVVEAARAIHVGHLDGAFTLMLEDAANFPQCLPCVRPAEMLKDTVREHRVKSRRSERQETSVSDNELCVVSQSRAHPSRRKHRAQRRVNPHNLISLLRGSHRPPPPATADVEEGEATARRQPQFRHRQIVHTSDQSPIKVPICRPYQDSHDRVHHPAGFRLQTTSQLSLLIRHAQGFEKPIIILAASSGFARRFERSVRHPNGLRYVIPQQHRHAIHERVSRATGSTQRVATQLERFTGLGAPKMFQEPGIDHWEERYVLTIQSQTDGHTH